MLVRLLAGCLHTILTIWFACGEHPTINFSRRIQWMLDDSAALPASGLVTLAFLVRSQIVTAPVPSSRDIASCDEHSKITGWSSSRDIAFTLSQSLGRSTSVPDDVQWLANEQNCMWSNRSLALQKLAAKRLDMQGQISFCAYPSNLK